MMAKTTSMNVAVPMADAVRTPLQTTASCCCLIQYNNADAKKRGASQPRRPLDCSTFGSDERLVVGLQSPEMNE